VNRVRGVSRSVSRHTRDTAVAGILSFTGYGPFGDGTRVYLSRARTEARHCRDSIRARPTTVAVHHFNSGVKRPTWWPVSGTPNFGFQQDSIDGRHGWMRDAAEQGRRSMCLRPREHLQKASRSWPASIAQPARSSWAQWSPFKRSGVRSVSGRVAGVVTHGRRYRSASACLCIHGQDQLHMLGLYGACGHREQWGWLGALRTVVSCMLWTYSLHHVRRWP